MTRVLNATYQRSGEHTRDIPLDAISEVAIIGRSNVGKSTFIKWLKEIFGLNMTYIKGDSFGSQFNSDWAAMLVVAIDEVFFDKTSNKYLSSQSSNIMPFFFKE